MGKTAKTDNANLPAKLALRRHFLRRYHAGTMPLVFDACMGEGVLWRTLRREFEVRYWGVDVKPKEGRLQVASERVLAQPGWTFDVVDVDTYGAPWAHWLALLPNVTGPLTVFLTAGRAGIQGSVDAAAREAMGLDRLHYLPPGIAGRLSHLALAYSLAQVYRHGVRVLEAREAPPGPRARYFGLRLTPVAP